MSTLVTGDAVVLELPPAGLGTRLLGFGIDVLAYGLLLFLSFFVFSGVLVELDGAGAAAATLTLVVLVLIVTPATIETVTRGRSLGKLALGLRVVRDDGGPIRSRHATARSLVAFVEYLVLALVVWLPTIILVLTTSRTKRLGDLVAGTYVIRERTALVTGNLPQAPPELRAWTKTLDLGQVPTPLALAARSFLTRADSLGAGARAELGARLASDLRQYVSPPPPPGTAAERFIAAVLVERRWRDYARLQSEAAQVERLRQLSAAARAGHP